MAAPIGNNFNQKYKTSEERQTLCKAYCDYIKQGYSKSFFPECDYDTFEAYCAKFPEDFPTDIIKQAEREGMHALEKIGFESSLGQIKGFVPASWIFIVKKKLGWRDKSDVTSDGEKINVIFDASLKQDE